MNSLELSYYSCVHATSRMNLLTGRLSDSPPLPFPQMSPSLPRPPPQALSCAPLASLLPTHQQEPGLESNSWRRERVIEMEMDRRYHEVR